MTPKKPKITNPRALAVPPLSRDELTAAAKALLTNPEAFRPNQALLTEYVKLSNRRRLSAKKRLRRDNLEHELRLCFGLENGYWLSRLDYPKYAGTLGQMRQKLIQEYQCTTTLELMLVDRIVAAYWRGQRSDSMYNSILEGDNNTWGFYDRTKINLLKEMTKGSEIAHRQLQANIVLLKELKQPPLNVNVKAENAYIAQNQQVIHEGGETIKAK